MVGRAIIAGEAAAIHAESHRQVLQRDVMDDHVVGALHEGRVNREERAEAFGGEAAGEKRGVFLGDADIVVAFGHFFFEDLELRAAGHRRGDRDELRIIFCDVGDGAAEEVRAGRRVDGGGGAIVNLISAEAVKFPRIVERGLVAAAFFGDDVKDDRLVERLEVFEGADQQRDVVAVDRAEVAQPEFLEKHIGKQQVFCAFLHAVGEAACGFAGDFFDKLRGLGAHRGVGVMGLQRVEITGDGADIFVDRPLVVVEHHDESAGCLGDVVQRLKRWTTSEGRITGDSDHMVVAPGEIARGGHAKRSRERGAGVTRTIRIVLRLRTQKESVEALVGADRVNAIGAAGKHLVDIALMRDIEDKLVLGRGEHAVQRDAQLDYAEVRAEVAAGLR